MKKRMNEKGVYKELKKWVKGWMKKGKCKVTDEEENKKIKIQMNDGMSE